MTDEKLGLDLTEWMKDTEFAPPDARRSARQVATRLPQTRQLGRRWWLPSYGRTPNHPPTADQTTDHQPTSIPSANGHSPTVLGRTQSMFSPVKAIAAGALVFALGGVLLIAQPFDQSGGGVPGAATDEERAAPVEVTGTEVEGACPGGPSTIDGLVEKTRGWACPHELSMSDPRLEGTFTRAWNLDWYRDGTGLVFGYTTGRLENADGAWQQRPGLRAGFDSEPDPNEDAELLVFDGEDAYEGLLAVLYLVSREDGVEVDPARLHGYIVEDEYPPSDHLVE